MANADSITTDSKIISGCFRLPRISIPKDVAEGDGRLSFKIETHNGIIDVSSWGNSKWECRGTVSALEAGGFLRPDWLPGLPGNNKTRQAVSFEADGPQLLYGNRYRFGKKKVCHYLVIKRISTNKYAVEVRTTDSILLMQWEWWMQHRFCPKRKIGFNNKETVLRYSANFK